MRWCFLLGMCFSGLSCAVQFKDNDIIFSRDTINSFFDAAECLSLRAPLDEKKGFLTAQLMALEWDINSGEMKSKEWLENYNSAADSDVIEVVKALSKYCPLTSRSVLANVRLDGYESSETHPEVLADIVARVISVDILNEVERRRVFEWRNKALGVDGVY